MTRWMVHYSVSTDRGKMFRHTYLESEGEPRADELRTVLADLEPEGTSPDQVLVLEIGEQMEMIKEEEGR